MLQLISWILFSAFEGIREGGSFSHGNSKYPFNIHEFFIPVRVLFAIILCFWSGHIYDLPTYVLIFSFIHDGCYYQTRHYIDEPNVNFFSESKESTAKFEFNLKWRLSFFILGLLIYFGIRLI